MRAPDYKPTRDKWMIADKPTNRCRMCGAEVGGGRKVHAWCWVAYKRREQRKRD